LDEVPGSGVEPVARSVRLSGPDTRREREERNFIADIEIEPVDNLFFKIGGMRTEQKIESLLVSAETLNNDTLGNHARVYDPAIVDQSKVFVVPEISRPFINPEGGGRIQLTANWFDFDGDGEEEFNWNDYKTVRSFWALEAIDSETDQVRAEIAYILETDFLIGRAKHNFLVGATRIRDKISFPSSIPEDVTNHLDLTIDVDDGQRVVYNDRFLSFNHPLDRNPFRYSGDPVSLISRVEAETEVEMDGYYFVYQGSFLQDRLMLIGGIRIDNYNVFESQFEMDFADFSGFRSTLRGDQWLDYTGSYSRVGPHLENVGTVANPILEPVLNEEQFPGGVEETSPSLALSYRINDTFTVYGLSAQGIFPNTGFKDGLNKGIPPEKSKSFELGVKFSTKDRKYSGSISFWKIKRENSILQVSVAPNPYRWTNRNDEDFREFNPDLVEAGANMTYMLRKDFLDPALTEFLRDEDGKLIRDPETRLPVKLPGIEGETFLQVNLNLDHPDLDPRLLEAFENAWAQTNFSDKQRGPYYDEKVASAPVLDDFIFLASPVSFTSPADGVDQGNNPSPNVRRTIPTNVISEDESQGVDFNFVWTPNPNFQLLFNYAHVEREITGVSFVDSADPETGIRYFTPWDAWVWYFGKEAFDANGDPMTFDGTGLVGVDSYFAPKDTANVWAKYVFTEGLLEGFSFAGGARYQGPATTQVVFGNPDLPVNQFITPELEERFVFDLNLTYLRRFEKFSLNLTLHVFNVFDDTYSFSEASFDDILSTGDEITRYRKTEVDYAPRSFRFSASFLF
jgi:outer membrane receptor protein involved in Fe transport